MKYTLDWNDYIEKARQAVAEGIVLIKNDNNVLPFKSNECISVFGRIQSHYYKSGTGSGGMVNVSHVYDIVEGLRESNVVTINEGLASVYANWEQTHAFDNGLGWGNEPWSQEEMPVDYELVKEASECSDIALVIIGRTAGEDKDSTDTEGSFRLTDIELDMLCMVRRAFDRMVVLLNVGGIIDMSFVDDICPDAVLYGWQGGMVGGLGTADVLTGKVSPSGRLTDTVSYSVEDNIANKNFGDDNTNFYCEDIYVGYRYFETFAKEKVRYPFGYGLSYTSFSMEVASLEINFDKREVVVHIKVTNTGACKGKQVVQLYVRAPQGLLGKPDKILIGFAKTKELEPCESEEIVIEAKFTSFDSYDEKGVTGYPNCMVLEPGMYEFLLGENVRDTTTIDTKYFALTILEKYTQALAPYESFKVLRREGDSMVYEDAVLACEAQDKKRDENIPDELEYTGDKGIRFADIYRIMTDGAIYEDKLKEFVAQLNDDELASIVRGEGMGSSLVTPGTASALGGVSKALRAYGIPAVCCDDGPSGMRLDCGLKAFSLPNGTLLGCTFNTELNYELYSMLGLEMISKNVECLLGPGMNIHRHPLNGRNFEYFSEDPFLTGIIATAQLRGLKKVGVSGTIKHFCGNNQEHRRHFSNSVISERALREIYLKGFEMAVRSGYADSVMTTYGKVNGRYTASIYDLTTTILRKQWGFKGIVMSDWWAAIDSDADGNKITTDFAAMIRAQNDLYMVCPNGETNESGDNTLEALEAGTLERAELQRCAYNICDFVLHSMAMKRSMKDAPVVEIINCPKDEDDVDLSDVSYMVLDGSMTISLDDKPSDIGANYILAFDARRLGRYKVTLVGSSELGELAQMSCTLMYNGFPIRTMTFHGTNGQLDYISRDVVIPQRFSVMRLLVNAKGLKLKEICFEFEEEYNDSMTIM